MSAALAATSVVAVVGLGSVAEATLATNLLFSIGGLLSGLGFGAAVRRVFDVS